MVDQQAKVRPRSSPIMRLLAAALLLAVGLVAAGIVAHASPGSPRRPGDKQVRAIGLASTVGARREVVPTSSSTAAPTVVSATPATTSPRSVHAVAPVPSVDPAAPPTIDPTTTTSVAPPGPPRFAPLPTVPTSNGTGAWHSNVVDGVLITLQMRPLSPVAGQTVHFSVTVTYQQGQGCCADSFNPGDGTFIQLAPQYNGPCGAAHPAVFTEQVDHVYNEPGVFSVAFNPGVLATCQAPPSFINTAQLYASVVVGAAS